MKTPTTLCMPIVRLCLRAAPLAGAALAGAHFGMQQDATDAFHRFDAPERHLTRMHHPQAVWDEFWCVDRSDVLAWIPDQSIPATIADELEDIMTGGGDQGWHGGGGLRIYLRARTDERFDNASIDCDLLSAEQRDKVKIEFRMREVQEVCDEDGEPPYQHPDWVGCAFHPFEGLLEYQGHRDYIYAWVQLDINHFANTSSNRHVVNHELGHVFGLDDPVPASECAGNISIMHDSFYCGDDYDDLEYPSLGDSWVVGSIMNEK